MSTERLKRALRIRFDLSSSEPSPDQLQKIIQDVGPIGLGHNPTDSDWRKSVYKHCQSAGMHKTAGVDNSDLNSLLQSLLR